MQHPATLLVVDDNVVVLAATTGLLRAAGFRVLEASSCADCLRVVREEQPHVVLLDVVLPDGSGVDLCRQIKNTPSSENTFVVLLSSREVSPDRQVSGLDAGGDGYIARPIENRELVARVQAMVRIQQAEAALRRAHDELERRVEQRTEELARSNIALVEEVDERIRAERAMRSLSLRLVEVQETERRFMARELHDEIGQVLTGLKITMDLLNEKVPSDLKPPVSDALAWLNDLMARVRRLSLDLRPQMLDDLGLLPALDWHFKRYTTQTGITVEFKHHGVTGRLPGALETAAYRLIQEALTNVARYAGVKQATVRVWADDASVRVQVEDSGAGFDPERTLAERASNGVSGMRERVTLLGGEFTLESAPGRGTRVTAELPREAVSTKGVK
jgi:signal transduction histidine kinase